MDKGASETGYRSQGNGTESPEASSGSGSWAVNNSPRRSPRALVRPRAYAMFAFSMVGLQQLNMLALLTS